MRNLCDLDGLHITAQTGDEHFDRLWGELRRSSEELQQSVRSIQKGHFMKNVCMFLGQRKIMQFDYWRLKASNLSNANVIYGCSKKREIFLRKLVSGCSNYLNYSSNY